MEEFGQMPKPRLFHQSPGALELVGIAVDADDLRTGETGNLHEGSPNAATEIGDDHPRTKLEGLRQKALMASD